MMEKQRTDTFNCLFAVFLCIGANSHNLLLHLFSQIRIFGGVVTMEPVYLSLILVK